MGENPDQPVVLDATVCSNYASSGSVAELVSILDRSVIGTAVRWELEGVARKYASILITSAHKFHTMPVSIDNFESGKLPQSPSVPEQVALYLYRHRDQAFTRAELAAAIDEDPNTVGTALTRLKDRNLVRHKGEYWAITDEKARLADAYDLHTISERLDEGDGGIDAEEWDAVAPDTPHPSERVVDEDG